MGDIDGSEAIDWTEFLAAALSVNGNFKETDGVGFREDASSADGQPVASLPRLTDDACWAAFELLSQGSGVVSGASLGQLLAPGEVQSWLERGSHMSFLGLSDQSARCEAKRVAELDRLVREVNTSGAIAAAEFSTLLKGHRDNRSPRSPLPQRAFLPPPPSLPPALE